MGRPKKQSSAPIPCFFKILMGDFTDKMRIPPAFSKDFHKKLIDESILRCQNGKVWHVEVKRDCGHLFFRNGWQDFVKDNSLEVGELLIFRYDGISGFDVQIFGLSGCEKVSVTMASGLHIKEQKPFKFIDVCPCKYMIKSVVSPRKNGWKNQSNEKNLAGTKEKVVFDAASCPLKLKHPHFTARWRPYKPYTVRIPQAFVREFNLEKKQSRFFRDPNGTIWPVNVVQSCNRSDFGSGLHDLRVGNNIREGDKCIFEFTQGSMIQPIPSAFTTEKGLRKIQSVFFCDPTGKLWAVKVCHSTIRCDFGAGWHDFVVGNKLSDGDRCVFEFVQDSVIKVHIFRARV